MSENVWPMNLPEENQGDICSMKYDHYDVVIVDTISQIARNISIKALIPNRRNRFSQTFPSKFHRLIPR